MATAAPIRATANYGRGPAIEWEPNWIDYRRSLGRADKRQEEGVTVELCPDCRCELDVTPAPHSPRCQANLAVLEVVELPDPPGLPEPEPKPPPDYPPAARHTAEPGYACKTDPSHARAKASRGRYALLCDDCIAVRKRGTAPKKSEGWLVTVPRTGLRYRSVMDAFVAADEIEADGERVAESARAAGNEPKAEQAIDESVALANRIRLAARKADPTAQKLDSEVVKNSGGKRVENPELPSLGEALGNWISTFRTLLDVAEQHLQSEHSPLAERPFRLVVRQIDP